ncbi:uncharacterized protein METZ01_LOCUS381985, partial [marine metagenome]
MVSRQIHDSSVRTIFHEPLDLISISYLVAPLTPARGTCRILTFNGRHKQTEQPYLCLDSQASSGQGTAELVLMGFTRVLAERSRSWQPVGISLKISSGILRCSKLLNNPLPPTGSILRPTNTMLAA